jgi:hypothetical protein
MNAEKQYRSPHFMRDYRNRNLQEQGPPRIIVLFLSVLFTWNGTKAPCLGQGQPGYLAPGDGSSPGLIVSSSVGRYVTFNWGTASGTASYQLNLRDVTTDPNGPVGNYPVNATTISILLSSRHAYKWNVYACSGPNATGTKTLSTNAWFRFLNPPYLESPGNSDLTPPVPKVLSLTPWISWDTVPESDGYWFYLSKAPYGQANIVYDTGFGTSTYQFQLPAGILEPGGSYAWNMTSLWETDESPTLGRRLYFTVDTLPTAPDSLSASGAASAIGLGWNHTSQNAFGQKLERKDGSSGTWNQIADLNWDDGGYSDSNVAQGVVYNYRIHAYNGIGDSALSYSGPASLTPTLYALNVNVYGQGTFTLSPAGGRYPAGTTVTVTSTPQSGYQFSEWRGAQYSRNPSFSFAKGGADESVELHFVPFLASLDLRLTTANSTPATLGIALPTPPSWLTIFERSGDLSLWAVISAVTGQNPTTSFSLPMTAPQGYVRARYCPLVTTAPFLDFPVHMAGQPPIPQTPSSAPVTAILDHHRPNELVSAGLYNKDHSIRTVHGVTYFVAEANRGPDGNGTPRDYATLPPGTVVSTLFNYVGVTSQGGTANLQYDGHPGYDYGFGVGTDIYAAASGNIMTDSDFNGTSLQGLSIASYYMTKLHALIIRTDPQGYCTVYMHLSDIDSTYVDKTDPSAWRPIRGPITARMHLGKSGHFDTISPVPDHFHFEVWRLDAGTDWNYADPYGFFVTNAGGTVVTCYPTLWTGN